MLLKVLIHRIGDFIIKLLYPENNWRREYAMGRLFSALFNPYKQRILPWFQDMLQNYTGKLFNRGWLIRFDYWLCWTFLGTEPDDYFDFEFFRKGWKWRNHHITKQRLNFFDPIFNDEKSKHLIRDKVEFYKRWDNYLKRNWCIPQDVTFEEFQRLFGHTSRILVKPTDDYGGHGIYDIQLNPANLQEIYDSLHNSNDKIVVEEYIQQKGFLNDIYPLALNPLRVTTVRINDKVDVCYAFFTAGCNGKIIANCCSGGIDFPVETESGRLGIGQSLISNGHTVHPDTGMEVAGKYVPDWKKIKEFACEAHRNAPDNLRLIGWDVCWNNGELSLIEGNNGPGFPELTDKKENMWKKMQGYLDLMTASEQGL